MIETTETVLIPRPIDEVFRYVADFSNIAEWDPGISASEKTSAGSVGVDTSYLVIVAWGLSSLPAEYTIKTWDAPHHAVLEGSGKGFTACDDIHFEDANGSTLIRWNATVSPDNSNAVTELLLGQVFKYYGRRTMRHLEKAFEERPAPGPTWTQTLADTLVVPGMLSFTRFGYERHRRNWTPLVANLRDRTIVVTGATSGLGRACAERLAELGASVIMVGRNAEKLAHCVDDIRMQTGSATVRGEVADLSLMQEVRALAERLNNEPAIHVLVNNAGVLLQQREETAEGLEKSFATNLLGHYLLTHLLLDKLQASAPARIVNVSSGGMYTQRIRVDDLQFTDKKWDGTVAYARQKRGQVIFTEMLAEKLADTDVVVHAMHPGWANTPGVETSLPAFHKKTLNWLRSPEEGADTMVWLAAAPEAALCTGKFWLDRQPRKTHVLPGTKEAPGERRALWSALHDLAGLPEE